MNAKPTRKRTTIDEVSFLTEVSTATVSRVINGSASVAEETVTRVRAAIEKPNYIPNHSARVLAGRKTRMLGLIRL